VMTVVPTRTARYIDPGPPGDLGPCKAVAGIRADGEETTLTHNDD
jgi:hypothetical protein